MEILLKQTHAYSVMRCTHSVQHRRCRLHPMGQLSTCNVHTPECSICLCRNDAGSVSLDCGHVFHDQCISHWFETIRRCPMCRHYTKPTKIRIMYHPGAPRLDHVWIRPILEDLVQQEILLTDMVYIASSGELVQSNGEFIMYLWGAEPHPVSS